MAGDLQASFQLDQAPLLRVAQFKLADSERLAIIAHHLVIDGVSWRIILEDLFTLYQQAQQQLVFDLPLKTDAFQYWT